MEQLSRSWTIEEHALIDWFLKNQEKLPREPFQLERWRRINNYKLFYQSLLNRIKMGPSYSYLRVANLVYDLKSLKQFIVNN